MIDNNISGSIISMTTNEVAEKFGVARKTVTMWCKTQPNIKRKIGTNGIAEYDLSKKDIELFKNRKSKGRPKKIDNVE